MPAVSETRVQFHLDQIHLLVVHETQIAIYDAQKLDWLRQVIIIIIIIIDLNEAAIVSFGDSVWFNN